MLGQNWSRTKRPLFRWSPRTQNSPANVSTVSNVEIFVEDATEQKSLAGSRAVVCSESRTRKSPREPEQVPLDMKGDPPFTRHQYSKSGTQRVLSFGERQVRTVQKLGLLAVASVALALRTNGMLDRCWFVEVDVNQ